MKDITQEQKRLLEPFGMIFGSINQMLRGHSDEDLRELLAASLAVNSTNCWCMSFDAAHYLAKEIPAELRQREKLKKNTA